MLDIHLQVCTNTHYWNWTLFRLHLLNDSKRPGESLSYIDPNPRQTPSSRSTASSLYYRATQAQRPSTRLISASTASSPLADRPGLPVVQSFSKNWDVYLGRQHSFISFSSTIQDIKRSDKSGREANVGGKIRLTRHLLLYVSPKDPSAPAQ
jgi:hypothetical protein